MRVDPEVNRLKFDRAVRILVKQRRTLESRGIVVLSSTAYPCVDLLFVPRHPVRAQVPIFQVGAILLPQMKLTILEVPSLAARTFKAHLDLTDYDLRAPSLEFRDPWDDSVLQYLTMFRALEFEEERKVHVVLLDDHPTTHKPFLCIRGIREYHEHPQHSGDDWLLYRKEMSLFSIVMSIWRASIDLVHPVVMMQPNQVQIQWIAEEKV